MSESSTQPRRSNGEPVVTTAVALIIAYIVADKFPVIGKVFMYYWNLVAKGGQSPTAASITEASLAVLFVFSFCGIGFGSYMARRGWVTYKQVMLSMFTALVTALFTIVNQSIPNALRRNTPAIGQYCILSRMAPLRSTSLRQRACQGCLTAESGWSLPGLWGCRAYWPCSAG